MNPRNVALFLAVVAFFVLLTGCGSPFTESRPLTEAMHEDAEVLEGAAPHHDATPSAEDAGKDDDRDVPSETAMTEDAPSEAAPNSEASRPPDAEPPDTPPDVVPPPDACALPVTTAMCGGQIYNIPAQYCILNELTNPVTYTVGSTPPACQCAADYLCECVRTTAGCVSTGAPTASCESGLNTWDFLVTCD
jgi:hypothetical protein